MIAVQDKMIPWRPGMTISDVLKAIGDSYPYAVVRINEKIYCTPDFDKVTVPDESEVFLIPLVAGG